MSRFSKRISLVVVFAFSLVVVCAAQQKPTAAAQKRPAPPERAPMRVTAAHLTGVNIPRSAACPVTMHFSGTITTNGPGEVKYTWVSSDGGTWPEGTLHFAKAGTEKVSQQLEQGAPGHNVSGWLQLKVVSPNTVLSNRVAHNVKCAAPVRRK